MALEGVRALAFAPSVLSESLLQAAAGDGALAFVGRLDDAALAGLAVVPPNACDMAEAAIHTDPARFLTRRAMTKSLLAWHLGCKAAQVELGHDARGAPFLAGYRDVPVHVSIAARNDMFALAIAGGPIGIDIEPVGEPVEPPWNILPAHERAWLRAVPVPERHRAFLQLWTLREAALKRAGTGFVAAAKVQMSGQIWSGWAKISGIDLAVACAVGPAQR